MVTAAGTSVAITTYQDDDLFGLSIQPMSGRATDELGGGYRVRALSELSTGHVQDVSVSLDDDLIAEVSLRVGDRDLLLLAGEAEQGPSGQLAWHRLDESVLLFTDPGEAEKVRWIPARGSLHAIS